MAVADLDGHPVSFAVLRIVVDELSRDVSLDIGARVEELRHAAGPPALHDWPSGPPGDTAAT